MPTRSQAPLSHVLLHLLRPHPEGVRVVALRNALQPRPTGSTVYNALRQLCQHGLVVRVGYGRYTLSSAAEEQSASHGPHR